MLLHNTHYTTLSNTGLLHHQYGWLIAAYTSTEKYILKSLLTVITMLYTALALSKINDTLVMKYNLSWAGWSLTLVGLDGV